MTGLAALVVGGWVLPTALLGAVTVSALGALQEPGPARPDDAVAALAGGCGLLVTGWLALAALVTAAAEFRPRTRWGATAATTAARIAPVALRRAVVLAVGLGMLGTSPAVAVPPAGPAAALPRATVASRGVPAPDPGWGAAESGPDLPDPGWVPEPAWQEPAPRPLPVPTGSATQDAFRRLATTPPVSPDPAVPLPTRPPTSWPPPSRPATSPSPARPGTAAPTGTAPGTGTRTPTRPGITPGTGTGTRTPTRTSTAPGAEGATVLVRPGDCLWDLAARQLGPSAGVTEIAARWPRWYAANRGVIGPEPDLLLPGLRLHPPALGTTRDSGAVPDVAGVPDGGTDPVRAGVPGGDR